MILIWTSRALADRRRIRHHIARDNPDAAIGLDERLARKASFLVDNPHVGPKGKVEGTRELVAHASFRLIYDVRGDTVRILRVLHTARRWPPVRG